MHYIGVDVGTGSARAAVVSDEGSLVSTAVCPIKMWNPQPQYYEQSSEDIWKAVCSVVKSATKDSGLKPSDIAGIGFDATCSLVVLDCNDKSISISPTHAKDQNVIVWMDHRAVEQADRINNTHHKVLDNVGGTISPEMETPKILWIKENLPEVWKEAGSFLDLADYLVFQSTGVKDRSLCTTVCKWTYQPERARELNNDLAGWDPSYFEEVGLGELTGEEGCKRIGTVVRNIGEAVGKGLTEEAAVQLGLSPHTPVSTALIDAHAGGLGIIGADVTVNDSVRSRMAIICGTSSCHMSVSSKAVMVNGVWGPYESAMVPGLHLSEGGQSATGSLLEHIVDSHAAGRGLREIAREQGCSVFLLLNEIVAELKEKQNLSDEALLVRNIHIFPDFHGNRSPRADPSLKGMISGLELDDSKESLAVLYLATVHAIAHGTKHIIDTVNHYRALSDEIPIRTLLLCGGLSKNPLFVKVHSDITQCPVMMPRETEAVLLGSAVAASVAANKHDSIGQAMKSMNHTGAIVTPLQDEHLIRFHNAKHEVFKGMYEDQKKYENIMNL